MVFSLPLRRYPMGNSHSHTVHHVDNSHQVKAQEEARLRKLAAAEEAARQQAAAEKKRIEDAKKAVCDEIRVRLKAYKLGDMHGEGTFNSVDCKDVVRIRVAVVGMHIFTRLRFFSAETFSSCVGVW
jgi:hypothetical protein